MDNWLTKVIKSKQRYKVYKEAVKKLPGDYQIGIKALEEYMWSFAKGEDFFQVLEDLLSMFQEAVMEGRSLKEVVGEDPVVFADSIIAEYPEELWINKYRNKLRNKFEGID